MMTLHVFNPEHDLALAANLANYTAPHAGRQLRADLGYVPAVWATEGDVVLVENVEDAERRFRQLLHCPFGRFITKEQISRLPLTEVKVWGWDLAIRAFLLRHGVNEDLLPTTAQIEEIRRLSHRQTAMHLLSLLQGENLTGKMAMAVSLDEVQQAVGHWGKVVVKAPWSSSGRGVRFLDGCINISDEGWIRHVIARQGAVMVEPYYAKVKDFGMEFESDGHGQVTCLGLSLFHTDNGAYTGNILADEDEKLEMLNRYISNDLIQDIKQKICVCSGLLFANAYQGPFGVDMMIVARKNQDGFLLHPCVEINLRRTMGHVALSLSGIMSGLPKVMNIECNNICKLKLRNL